MRQQNLLIAITVLLAGCAVDTSRDASIPNVPVDGGLPTCGNGQIDTGEVCDGSNLNNRTCTTEGFASGTLVCNSNCTFNTTGCIPATCNNGQTETRVRYESATVPSGETCSAETQTRACLDGAWRPWDGSFTEERCAVDAPAGCDGGGHGDTQSRTRYSTSSIDCDHACVAETQTRTCDNGTWSAWSGSFAHDSCGFVAPTATSSAGLWDASGLAVGGSNYLTYDASGYYANPSDATWYGGGLKMVIAHYHLDPATVAQQLRTMYCSGQRKISLLISFGALRPTMGVDVWGHLIDSSTHKLLPQHEANLRNVLGVIRASGFSGIFIRFGAQDVAGWSSWDEASYQSLWNFIVNTRAVVEDVLGTSAIRRWYDLFAEGGGLNAGQIRPFVKRVWIDYCSAFGNSDTYGFSFAVSPGRVTAMIETYDETGVRPPMYAFDVYGDAYNSMDFIADELAAKGELGKPVLIQETYYNDSTVLQELLSARAAFGLNLYSIVQWPLARGLAVSHFSMSFSEKYASYRTPPVVVAGGTGCADNNCVYLVGKGFDANACVVIRISGSATIEAQLCGASDRVIDDVASGMYVGYQNVTLRVPSNLEGSFGSKGLVFWVMNVTQSNWSDGWFIQRPP